MTNSDLKNCENCNYYCIKSSRSPCNKCYRADPQIDDYWQSAETTSINVLRCGLQCIRTCFGGKIICYQEDATVCPKPAGERCHFDVECLAIKAEVEA